MPKSIKKYYGKAEGPLGFPMHDRTAQALDDLLKRQPKEIREQFRSVIGNQSVDGYCRVWKAPAATDLKPEERADVSLITTASVDRDLEVVLPQGGDLRQFRQNPVVTWAHNYHALPVGRAMWIQREKHDDPRKDGFSAKTQYTVRPEGWGGDWFADAVWSMVQSGELRGKSIGFLPMDGRVPKEEDLKARPELAKVRFIISKWVLLEFAVAPVPSNPDALVQAAAKCKQFGIALPQPMLDASGLTICDDLPAISEYLDAEPEPGPESQPAVTDLKQQNVNTYNCLLRALRRDTAGMVREELERARGRV